MNRPEIRQIIELDLHANNYRDGQWGSVRHIVVREGGSVLLWRLANDGQIGFAEEAQVQKEVEHAFINTLVRGDVSSLTWVESANQYFPQMRSRLGAGHELCAVYFAAVSHAKLGKSLNT